MVSIRPRRGRATPVALALAALGSLLPATSAAPVAAQGVVEGRVHLSPPPPRRSAARYPGGAGPTGTVQSIPVLVWIQGPVAGAGTDGGGTLVMAQRDTVFVPSGAVVPVGTTVRFPNEDPFFHNVFSYSSAARFDLGRYPRGESKSVRLDEPGIVKIYCEVHETMRAVVVVAEHPFHAEVGGDGTFRLEGVPAGRHTVVVWHADLGSVERTVEVQDGGVVRLEVELG